MLDLSTLRLLVRRRLAGRKVYASISGGKDSVAMALWFLELGIEFERVFADTGWEHPALYEHLRGPVTAAIGPIHEVRGEMDFVELVAFKGLFPSRVMRFCTEHLKVLPIQKYLLEQSETQEIVNAVGIRRAESKARSQMAEWEWSDSFDCEIWRPLVTWTKDDVLAIHARHNVPLAPLYEMGAGRVGCWPCIHSAKKEIALVAEKDPGRIDLIERLERRLTDAGAARDAVDGREPVPRTMYSYHGGDNVHHPINIREAVEWAKSKRGEWQPPGAGDGCMRFGLCESSADEEEIANYDDCAINEMPRIENTVAMALAREGKLPNIGHKPIIGLDILPLTDGPKREYVCSECGTEQDTDDVCVTCGSLRVVTIKSLESIIGPDWRKNFDGIDPKTVRPRAH